MTLKELRKILNDQYKKCPSGEVEFKLDGEPIEIAEMGRFGFVRDITITMRRVECAK